MGSVARNLRFILALSACLAAVTLASSPPGYVVNKADGRNYRLVYQAKAWQDAQDLCAEEGAKLAVPKSKEEFKFIQRIVRGMYYPAIKDSSGYKLLAWVGVNNLENYKIWKNVDGEDIAETEFHEWAGQNGFAFSDNPQEPHCAGVDAVNYGLRDWWCHHRQPYICQRDVNTTIMDLQP